MANALATFPRVQFMRRGSVQSLSGACVSFWLHVQVCIE
eukprot:CAMPEP_0183437186 /NCGR_PEP_ID=MMETSP0370-20130417/71941_1 /TAXON_ID=268820 /ORGANISM="Peridinium aciculiferum, Strain PAER-2" /LENGTH=38 /DNA_ID= /DNA_START= /DNA_END= /DNA_ORIENTATION=